MYGVEPDFFIGKNLREIIDNRYTNLLNRQIDRVKSGLSDRYEIEVADFRGNPHVGKVTSSPWRGANQEIMGSIIVFSDITQSKLTEEHLRFISTHDDVTLPV
jgi:PAS domain S-box-containing protein